VSARWRGRGFVAPDIRILFSSRFNITEAYPPSNPIFYVDVEDGFSTSKISIASYTQI
jgi:hypothetical protein